ncbi:MAG: XRE family transcriptional regulator [Proteobacteria bacterium]|nr:MAG: XRE family transcriptional regulator [Pseudomonadota bacterium]
MSEKLFLTQLGQLIRNQRRVLHLSQEELAWRCNITKNGLGKIELGQSQVRITTLMTILRELNLNIYDLQILQDAHYPFDE